MTHDLAGGNEHDHDHDVPTSAEGAIEALRRRLKVTELERDLAQLKLRGIEDISRALGSEHNLDRILDTVMERTTALLGADRATLYLIDKERQILWSKVTQGDGIRTIELPIGQGIAGWVAKNGRTVNVKDAYKDPRFDHLVDQETQYRTRSILCHPMVNTHQQIVGVIQVLNKLDGYFTTADEDLLSAICSQAAITVQNSRLYLDIVGKNIDLIETQLRLKERSAELEFLFQVERAAATASSRAMALQGVLEETLAEYPCEVGSVILLDAAQDRIRYECLAGHLCEQLEDAFGRRVLTRVLDSGSPLNLGPDGNEPDARLDVASAGLPIHNLLALPISHYGEPLGCLVLVNRRDDPGGFDASDLRILGVISNRMALAIVLARALEEDRKAERLSAIGRMLSGVVHDLKTPLTIVNGYAHMMAKEADAERRAEIKGQIESQIRQIRGMTQELLSFARGESTIYKRKVLVSTFLDQMSELLREEFSGSGVALRVVDQHGGTVRFDENKMSRVFFNLARNAREAMADEGGTFTITVWRDPDGESGDPSQIVFQFADDGPGIPPEMEGRLFDSFATFGKKNGTGLGLAIVQRIVDEHGGTIGVSSAFGEGTTFTVRLPENGEDG